MEAEKKIIIDEDKKQIADDPRHRFKVPAKKKNETYEQLQERVNAHNYNFMKNIESRYKAWKGPGKPPIVKDKEGKLVWLNRKQRRSK